ncbi:hypothetical protein D3C87_1398560 [compost metagenome]
MVSKRLFSFGDLTVRSSIRPSCNILELDVTNIEFILLIVRSHVRLIQISKLVFILEETICLKTPYFTDTFSSIVLTDITRWIIELRNGRFAVC